MQSNNIRDKISNQFAMEDCGEGQDFTFQIQGNIIHRIVHSSVGVELPMDNFTSYKSSEELQDERLFVVSPKQPEHLQSISSDERYQSYPKCVRILDVDGVDEGIGVGGISNITEHKFKPHISKLVNDKGSMRNVMEL